MAVDEKKQSQKNMHKKSKLQTSLSGIKISNKLCDKNLNLYLRQNFNVNNKTESVKNVCNKCDNLISDDESDNECDNVNNELHPGCNVDNANSDIDSDVDVVGIDDSNCNHIHKLYRKKVTKKTKIASSVSRELCECCHKPIYTHQPVVICPTCPLIVHNQCVADANFEIGEGSDGISKWYCHNCYETHGIKRYNPFFECIESDKSHENSVEPATDIECISKISDILNNCSPHNIENLNAKIISNMGKQFSTFFFNVDGNATNFDQFVAELQLYNHEFSVIALAETNIDQCNQNMYQIDNYQSVYQSKR